MAGQVVSCPHMVLRNLQIDIDLDVIKEIIHCGVCNEVRQDLWLCLFRECFVKVCCATGDHRIAHQKKNKKHCLFVSVRTMRVWCTTCNGYVLLTGNNRQSVESTKPQPNTSPANNKRRNFDPIDNTENSDDETTSTSMEDSQYKPTGLTGLQNIGNTCYMNAALQALSNTPPLTEFFLSCGLTAISSGSGDSGGAKKMMTLSKSYHRLMQEIWDSKGRGYVAPTGILYGIRNAHPMFRGYHQHDTQEFLRCFMDLLHEELKVAISEPPPTFESVIHEQDDEDMSDDESPDASVPNGQLNSGSLASTSQYGEPLIAANDARPVVNEGEAGGASSQSEGDEYETCDSGVSERSSLSEETTSMDTENNRSLSGSPSPLPGRSDKLSSARNGSSSVGTPRSSSSYYRKKVQVQYRSIISDVFDGKLLSSVQCLTCNRISTRMEAFQDLSLPIPSRDHLHMLHQGSVNSTLAKCTELYSVDHGWLTWIWEWLCSWFWGPAVSLHDCLAAFFSADELKGDNMYSCEKCNKLRNGVKFSKVLQLPEVLCIHLKRFRHDLMYSSKINSHVTFPLEGLELRPYLHKHCVSQVTQYDLISVICHHGAAGSGGHYTCYALNNQSDHWYEFDDQCVTRVSSETVRTCEAYVLFYRKKSTVVDQYRHRASNLMQRVSGGEPVGPVYAVSKQWINRFNTFAEPGPIDNSDFLCHHGKMVPGKETDLHSLTTSLPAPVWDYLYEKYGGGPICTLDKLSLCEVCNNNNITPESQESNLSRLELEVREFSKLEQDLQRWPSGSPMNAIWLKWFVRWNAYVKGKSQEPPGPIDNGQLLSGQNRAAGQVTHGKDYRQVSKDQWDFLQSIYGGGPEVLVKLQNNQSVIEPVATPNTPPSPSSGNNSSETEIIGDSTTSSGNWSVTSSVVDNSQADDNASSQMAVADPIDIHQSSHVGRVWFPSQSNQDLSSPLPMEIDDTELTDMAELVSEMAESGNLVSTSLLDIRIDSTQPSNIQTNTTDNDSNTTPVHPIHSSMPTVAQEGKVSDKSTDSPSASEVC